MFCKPFIVHRVNTNHFNGGKCMKWFKLFCGFSLCVAVLATLSCSDGGGSSSTTAGSGIVTMSITDAKPMLPANITAFKVKFDEVLVHKSGGGWISLPMAESPHIIDLLQFIDGDTTEFVPPVRLVSGKYTQVRIVISEAWITVSEGSDEIEYMVTIPSENLKTDKNFDFYVGDLTGVDEDSTGVDIIVDFDLSMSLKVENNTSPTTYTCKPVLHLAETKKAATIVGHIDDAAFGDEDYAIVSVFVRDPDSSSYEEYTKIMVTNTASENPELFTIFWLVPNKEYLVEITSEGTPVRAIDTIDVGLLSEEQTYDLYEANEI